MPLSKIDERALARLDVGPNERRMIARRWEVIREPSNRRVRSIAQKLTVPMFGAVLVGAQYSNFEFVLTMLGLLGVWFLIGLSVIGWLMVLYLSATRGDAISTKGERESLLDREYAALLEKPNLPKRGYDILLGFGMAAVFATFGHTWTLIFWVLAWASELYARRIAVARLRRNLEVLANIPDPKTGRVTKWVN